jgi:uncharacterized membrane protein
VTGTELGLVASVFLACAVEAVEALTIVLAVGSTRSWRSALTGAGLALCALAVLTAGLGTGVTNLPLNVLRAVIGGLLLVFGLQWLRKAMLRAAGLKTLHDETAAFAAEAAAAAAAGASTGTLDAYACSVAFKGTFLEGLEVVFIALTFGANQHDVGLAALAALAAVLAVAAAGVALRAPLARVPENTLKFVVGILLTSFGMFWAAEGVHARWPGGEASLPVIIAALTLLSLGTVAVLRRSPEPRVHPSSPGART